MPRPDELPSLAYTGDGPSIFVSYAREDSNLVYREIKRLQDDGYRFWYDRSDIAPGRDWSDEIDKAISKCSCFLVFITPAAVKSEYVGYEMERALAAGKPFICIYWEKLELPSDIQQRVSKIQALERYTLHTSEYEEQLYRSLSEHVGKPKTHDREARRDDGKASGPPPPSGLSWIAVYFILLLLAVASFLLAVAVAVTPFFATTMPGDPLSSRLAGFLAGGFFIVIACGLCAVAFVVKRKHPSGRND